MLGQHSTAQHKCRYSLVLLQSHATQEGAYFYKHKNRLLFQDGMRSEKPRKELIITHYHLWFIRMVISSFKGSLIISNDPQMSQLFAALVLLNTMRQPFLYLYYDICYGEVAEESVC